MTAGEDKATPAGHDPFGRASPANGQAPADARLPSPAPLSLQPGLRDSLRGLPPAAWALFVGTFINRFGSFVLVFLVLYLTDRGYSVPQAGVAVTAYALGALASTLAGGWLADRVGRRATISASMFAAAGALLALSQAERYGVILVLAAAAGFTADLYRPAATALVADLTPAGRRVTAFAVYRLSINLGVAAGPAVAGFLAERSFLLLFLGDALTCTLYGFVALFALPAGRVERAHERAGPGVTRAILDDGRFQLFLLSTALVGFVFLQAYSTLPLHVRDVGLSASDYGLLMSLNGALIVLLELALTSWTQRLPVRRVLTAGVLLTGTGFGLTALSGTLPLLAVTVAVWTLGEIFYSPVATAYVADLAPERMRGRYQAAYGLAFGLGVVAAPAVGTVVYDSSPLALWALCLVAGGAGAVLVAAAVAPASARA